MDYNVIQAPELLARLQRYLGMRQQHVASTLNEGVQPVVIMGDVSREAKPGEREPFLFGASANFGGGVLNGSYVELFNLANSGVLVKPKHVEWSGDIIGVSTRLFVVITKETVAGSGNVNGYALDGGEVWNEQLDLVHLRGGTDTFANMLGTGLSHIINLAGVSSPALPYIVPVEGIQLPPGFGLRIFSDVGAFQSYFNLRWTVELL